MVDEDDDRRPVAEWKLRAGALPGALVIAYLLHLTAIGSSVQRIALAMPLHELGHAITAWWCGFSAIPTFWKTLIGETRSTGVTLLLAAALAAGAWRAWTTDRMALVGVIAGLGALAFLATTASPEWADAAITFAGDAGAIVLGTALMLAFAAGGPDSWLRRGQLRWGLLAIGAAAFVDTAAMWWQARTDTDVIPYGEIEGVGQSDPSKLLDIHEWVEPTIVHRYSLVIELCVLALAVGWVLSVWIARARREEPPSAVSEP